MQGDSRDKRGGGSGGAGKPRQTRRHFTEEFKLEAVRLAERGDRPFNAVAHDLGVRPNVLRQWRRQAAARAGHPPEEIFPGQRRGAGLASRDEEVRRLQREVARLTEERDILKKAAAFFAKEAR
jgi:transposase